ncbi:uncharacterized protein LOC134202334 [Armigeres subalbatus]|uniref:uncharacterized protein LOC134202334 n=1 Tax=Armigeres subalbatus TaxID=124917 RepID=UPI002ECFF9E8
MQDSSDSRHCKKCTKPDEADNMVGCDACDAWEHYGCAGVSDSIADSNRSWKCESCKRPAQITSAPESSVSAYTSASSKKSRQAQLRLELLEQQNQVRMRKLEEEERYLKEKFEILMQFEEEDEIISNRSKVSARSKQERLENWLRQDNTPISDGEYEIPHGVEKGRGDPEILKSVIEEQPVALPALEIKSVPRKLENRVPIESTLKVVPTPTPRKTTTIITSRTSNTYPTVPAFGSATVPTVQYFGHLPSNKILKPSEPSTNVWNVSSTETVEPAVCKNTTLKISTVPTGVETSGSHQNKFQRSNHQMPELDPISFSQGCQKTSGPFTADSRPQFPSPGLKPENYHLEPVASGPTTSQLAARQVMPKDLPIFSGDPEDWPMFYSSFKNSTQVCGYSDAENLARLQRCLRGSALDSVRSRLLLPSSVGSVISTLQMLYGRPEILINSLLRRVRSTQAPKADNLKSIVDYGLAVQNLIDHMIISQQQNHLENPLLLNELVEKLPTNFKLQWSSYKQGQVNINLATFNGFVSNLVYLASDLLVTSDSYHTNLKGHRSEKQKEKLFVHAQDPTHESDDEAQSSGTTSQDRLNKPCSYCDVNGHYIVNCQPFKALTVDARWKAIRSKNLCRTCLVPHRRWPCRSKRECELEGCRARHHQLLHAPQLDPVATATSSDMPVHQNHHQSHSISLFRYLPVKLFANGKVVKIFAFLDEGSSSTLLEAEVAKQLDMDGPSSSLWLSWTGNISREEKGSKCVSLTIAGERSLQKYTIDNVLTVDELNLPKQSFNYESLATQHPHMVGLPLQSYSNVVPRMIIGLEHARLLTSLKTREGPHEGPVVVKTRLGWCAFGKESGMTHISEQLNFHNTVTNQSLHDIMKCYFAVEESAVSLRPEAEEDKRALHILQKTTVRQGNRYETGLLWRIDNPTFPDSLSMAKSRLKSLEKRMQCDPELAANVQGQIDSYVRKGYAHKATPEELQRTDARHVWYLPLGVVVSPKKPEKIRLIWDAAAKVQGVSLNDLLLKGPDLHVSLITVILRFRERNIAVCGDICEMFHQIRIRAEDRQYQRFLWRSNSTEDIDVYVMDVATFGATCSPCSAQYIKNKNAEEHSKVYPRAARAITENHYVDDFLDSTDTVEEAVQLVEQVKAIHASAGFEIKKFKSNYSEVLNTIGETDTSTGKPINADKQGSTDRVLGLVGPR